MPIAERLLQVGLTSTRRFALIHASALMLALILPALPLTAGTIYVDAANAGSGTMDGSAGDPWDTITKGVDALALSNAVSAGNHVILVTTGTYTEQASLDHTHSGADGSNNVLRANGAVTIDGATHCIFGDHVHNFTIDGFKLTQSVSYIIEFEGGGTNSIIENCVIDGDGGVAVNGAYTGIYLDQEELYNFDNLVIRNCDIYRCVTRAFYMQNGSGVITIENCNFVHNRMAGIELRCTPPYGPLIVKDTVIAGNSSCGIFSADTLQSNLLITNNVFFGNTYADVYATWTTQKVYNGQAEINAVADDFTNNIVANPGFAALADDWNFDTFYANSPCLNGAPGGHIGSTTNPVSVPVSSNTYYVATGGNDGRTKAQAQSQATPWQTINRAASQAVAGDTVIVEEGVYSESVVITNGGSANLNVSYLADGEVAVDGVDAAIKLDGVAGVYMNGFRCINSTYGLHLSRSMANGFFNFVCCSNSSSGVLAYYSPSNRVESAKLFDNTTYGLYGRYGSGSIVDRALVYRNPTGIYLYYGTPSWRILNSNIYSNSANGIRGLYFLRYIYNVPHDTRVENCTIAGNGETGVMLFLNNANLRVISSIITECGTGIYEDDAGGDIYPSYCCLWNNGTNFYDEDSTVRQSAAEINAVAGCSNNIVADTGFRTASSTLYRLEDSSACVNAGSPGCALKTDITGRQRIVDDRCDIGSYELPPGGTVILFK